MNLIPFDEYFNDEEQEFNEIYEVTKNSEEKKPFKITDQSSLHWVFRKLKQIKEEEENIKASYQYELDRLKNWKEKEMEQSLHQSEFFEGLLLEYLLKEKETNPDFRIKTPLGSANVRKQQEKYEYDEEIFLSWAKEFAPDYVRTKESVNKSLVRKKFIADKDHLIDPTTGELVPGVRVVPVADKLSIKLQE